MVAKVIAHGPTRDGAIRTLRRALHDARLHGPVTNRDQLVRVLDHPAFVAGELHTGFLDEHPCTDRLVGDERLAAAAVALAEQAANRRPRGCSPASRRAGATTRPSTRLVELAHGDAPRTRDLPARARRPRQPSTASRST